MSIFSNVQKRIFSTDQKRFGSKFFQKKIPSIPAGSSYLLSFENDTDALYWLPFDYCAFSNEAGVNFQVWINQDKNNSLFLANGTIKILEDQAITSLRIVNNSTSTASTSNDLILSFRKKGIDTQNFVNKFSKFIGV